MSGFVMFLIACSLSPTAQPAFDDASPLTPEEKASVEGHQTLRLMDKLVAVSKRRQVTNSINQRGFIQQKAVYHKNCPQA
jgi:hypothetical protein